MWLLAMPVAAAQLVLLTAAEDGALVGDEGWASALPLAASGPGEPFVTAAGVLGARAGLASARRRLLCAAPRRLLLRTLPSAPHAHRWAAALRCPPLQA